MEKQKGYCKSFKLCIGKEKTARVGNLGKPEAEKSEKTKWKREKRAAFRGQEIAFERKGLKLRKGAW